MSTVVNSGLDELTQREAVRTRDARFDGRFVYGVETTGVYCRPSCPSRAARPENLRFFPGGPEARRAGFRACLRCKPEEQAGAWVARLCRELEARAEESVKLNDLATEYGMSPTHLLRAFQAATGVTPRAYHEAQRSRRLRAALREEGSVTDAGYAVGLGSSSRLHARIEGGLGMTPSAYRRGGEGDTIAYATRPTALGVLLMAATDRGVCSVQLGDTADELVARLAAEYPAARRVPAPAESKAQLDAWMAELEAHLASGGPSPSLPLDVRGTAFQLRVWNFLRSIPAGAAMSYAEVADALGAPRSARAVARACASNRLAVLIPCHRVLRGDGGLGGYRWGLARKRALLDAERADRAGRPA